MWGWVCFLLQPPHTVRWLIAQCWIRANLDASHLKRSQVALAKMLLLGGVTCCYSRSVFQIVRKKKTKLVNYFHLLHSNLSVILNTQNWKHRFKPFASWCSFPKCWLPQNKQTKIVWNMFYRDTLLLLFGTCKKICP